MGCTARWGFNSRGWVSDQLKPASRSLAEPESSCYTGSILAISDQLNRLRQFSSVQLRSAPISRTPHSGCYKGFRGRIRTTQSVFKDGFTHFRE